MNSSPSSIDVVIPAYNAGQYITQTLQSVAKQDVPIANIIVVNDGSTDNTQVCVEAFIKANANLNIVLINQANAGLSAARNAGIRHSKADFIAPLDADDLWKPNKLSSQLKLFADSGNPQLGVVYCAYELIDDAGKNISSNPRSVIAPTLRGKVYKSLLRGNFISASGSGVLVKRSVFDTVGLFDESLRACEDWDMWLRIALQYQFDFVNTVLVSIRVHQNNMQKDLMRMLSAELMVLNKFTERSDENSFLLWKIRTYLFNKGVKANTIPGFEKCTPRLQTQLSGWRMGAATTLLAPARILANLYLKTRTRPD